jgi:hypothetical protein
MFTIMEVNIRYLFCGGAYEGYKAKNTGHIFSAILPERLLGGIGAGHSLCGGCPGIGHVQAFSK